MAVMAQLNRAASEAMVEVGAHAATDITGFGLLGHLAEMATGSGLQATVVASSVPMLDEVYELAVQGMVPGGTRRNLASLEGRLLWEAEVPEPTRLILGDAQTSGGLLIAVAPDSVAALLAALSRRDVRGAVIGRLDSGAAGAIRITL
jgi:selenide,water dikinase